MSLRSLGYTALFFTVLLESPAFAAGDPSYFCKLDNEQEEVLCIRTGEALPVFEYRLKRTAPLSTLFNLENIKVKRGAGPEQFRINLERFRKSEVEAFRLSLESFRSTVETMREANKIDLALYKQVMFVYSDLLLRYYGGGLHTYELGIIAYHKASYPTF